MKNIRIKQIRNNYFQVLADTERFGQNEILFEGISYDECASFIRENTKPQKKPMWAVEVQSKVTRKIHWVVVISKDSWTAFKRVWNMGYNNGFYFYKRTQI